MAQLKFGVIGFRMGRSHARAIAACPKTKLVAVADLAESLRQEAREAFGLTQVYETYQELIEKSDAEAVTVALPVPLHYPCVTMALKAGKHVLCEKPPANSAGETAKLVALAKSKGLTLSWGLQRRYLPEMHAARAAIKAGKLGKVYRVDGQYTHARIALIFHDKFRMLKKGGGVFFDIGIHTLDMAWSLMGCPKPVRVVAANHTAFPDWNAVEKRADMAEDNSFAMVFFDNGAVVTVEVCYFSNRENPTGHSINLRLLGDKGGLHIPSLVYSSGDKAESKQSQLAIKDAWKKPAHQQFYANFADVVAGKGELLIRPEHGLALMKMVDAVIKSANTGKEIRLS